VHTAFLLVATTCLAGSVPGWDYWDGGYGDAGYVVPCGYSYGYGYPGYDSGCYGWYGGNNPWCYPCWGPCWAEYGNPCRVAHPNPCCNPHDCCLHRLHDRWKCHHQQPPPPCWGWDPSGGGPCFQGGGPPYGNCGWNSVLAAEQASTPCCSDDGCGKHHGKHQCCLKKLCEHWREKHGCHAPCFDPCAGPWGGCSDNTYGGPPVAWGE
jgi:hypothetical protein